MRVISLFSGIGGSSEGYISAGATVLASVEFLDYQAKVYRDNHPETRLYEEDIRKLDPLEIIKDLGLKVGELDVLDGSPPCSSFSVSGKGSKGWGQAKNYGNKKQVTDDLFFEYIRFVDAIRPKFFVAENVKGLILGNNKAYLSYILKSFPKEYRIKIFLLNSKDFGVPQSRNRVFIIGARRDVVGENFDPSLKRRPPITAGRALEGIVPTKAELEEANIEKYSIYPKLKALKAGESAFNLVKANPYRPSPTITATIGGRGSNALHHWDNRRFTVAELKRLAGIRDDFTFDSVDPNRAREGIGRAVTPPVTEAIANSIKEILEND
ncbi:MAG: DNA cytosine methyltransferase [Planctomycetes bacterium]|nr:DNA cytosine methyltransferase [Planctomycetota bacterium]